MTGSDSRFADAVQENVRFWMEQLAPPTPSAPAEIVQELPNMLQAVRYGLALSRTQSEAARLLVRMHRSAERAGWWQQWLALSEAALQAGKPGEWRIRARVLNGRGVLLRHCDLRDEALADHRMAGELAKKHGDELLWAQAQHLGALDLVQGHLLAEAETDALAALDCFVEQDPGSDWHAAALSCLGDIARIRQDYDRAEALLSEAVRLHEILADNTELARTLNNLALTWQAQEQWQEAVACYERALRALEGEASEITKSLVRNNYGTLLYMREQYQQAELVFREADTLALRQSGDVPLRSAITQNIGSALLAQGSYIEAEWHLNRAAELWRQSKNNLSLANTTGDLAELYALRGEAQKALELYDEALQLLTGYPDHPWALQMKATFQAAQQALQGS